MSGCINQNGILKIEVTKEFRESTVSKILELIENASSKKSKSENFITKFAKYYTPIVVMIAVILAIIPPLLFENQIFSAWLYRSLSFLVVSCPCALVISIPLSFFGGLGRASKMGILIKGSNYLEALANTETVVFDNSGKGIEVKVEGKEILVGNEQLMEEKSINYTSSEDIGTVIYVAINNQYAGYILISDKIKQDSKKAIEAADIVIMTDEPSKISNAIKLSKKTMRIVKKNIIFAIAVKVGVLILSTLGMSTMWEAVLADVGVSIIAIINSLRVLKSKKM